MASYVARTSSVGQNMPEGESLRHHLLDLLPGGSGHDRLPGHSRQHDGCALVAFGPTVTQRKFPSSASVTSTLTSNPTVPVQKDPAS